jgi:hypothetical protein
MIIRRAATRPCRFSIGQAAACIAATVLLNAVAAAQPLSPEWLRCEVTGGDFLPGGGNRSSAHMRLRAGVPCTMTQSDSRFRLVVAEPPRHGAVSVDGARATYRPTASFAGVDVFVLCVVPIAGGAAAPLFTTVSVEVR